MLISHWFLVRYARTSRRRSLAPVTTLDHMLLEQHAHG